MTGERTAKKDRDPIFTVCLVVFLIAAVIVTGIYVQKTCFPMGDETASVGDKVTVNYIGTYYDEFGKENAVVFDTSKSDVANNDSYAKSNDFTKKTSYSPLDVTIGSNTMIRGFEDSIVGHKVGDRYMVTCPANESYYGATDVGTLNAKGNKMSASFEMPLTQFQSAYSDVKLVNGESKTFTTKYGWDAQATLVENKTVVITYLPTVNSDGYKVYESGETVVKYIVTSIDDGEIVYDIDIKGAKKVDGNEIQMIKLDLGGQVIYITEIDTDGTITYKSGNNAEKVNETLYFQIEIVKIA